MYTISTLYSYIEFESSSTITLEELLLDYGLWLQPSNNNGGAFIIYNANNTFNYSIAENYNPSAYLTTDYLYVPDPDVKKNYGNTTNWSCTGPIQPIKRCDRFFDYNTNKFKYLPLVAYWEYYSNLLKDCYFISNGPNSQFYPVDGSSLHYVVGGIPTTTRPKKYKIEGGFMGNYVNYPETLALVSSTDKVYVLTPEDSSSRTVMTTYDNLEDMQQEWIMLEPETDYITSLNFSVTTQLSDYINIDRLTSPFYWAYNFTEIIKDDENQIVTLKCAKNQSNEDIPDECSKWSKGFGVTEDFLDISLSDGLGNTYNYGNHCISRTYITLFNEEGKTCVRFYLKYLSEYNDVEHLKNIILNDKVAIIAKPANGFQQVSNSFTYRKYNLPDDLYTINNHNIIYNTSHPLYSLFAIPVNNVVYGEKAPSTFDGLVYDLKEDKFYDSRSLNESLIGIER